MFNSLPMGQGFRLFFWGGGEKYSHIVNMYFYGHLSRSEIPSTLVPPLYEQIDIFKYEIIKAG